MIKTPIALASASPRRLALLQSLDLDVRVVKVSHNELIDPAWLPGEIPLRLAQQKSRHARTLRKTGEVLITADTVVLMDGEILHKPAHEKEARRFLEKLSNRSHEVITGVCLSGTHEIEFSISTTVWLNKLSSEAIQYYINTYQPFDKAGAYGIQEWIGWTHVRRIAGSYSNVMGLPTSEVYQAIRTLRF